MVLPYEVGLNKIYANEEIEEAKLSPSFKREFGCEFSYGVGNIFTEQLLEECINKKLTTADYRPKSLGCDCSLGGNASFAFVLTELADDQINVLRTWLFNKFALNEIVEFATELMTRHNPRMYVDASYPSFINSVKRQIGESEDIHTRIQPVSFGLGHS
jgi:hypothetical protein